MFIILYLQLVLLFFSCIVAWEFFFSFGNSLETLYCLMEGAIIMKEKQF
jgi:hypothetical protein